MKISIGRDNSVVQPKYKYSTNFLYSFFVLILISCIGRPLVKATLIQTSKKLVLAAEFQHGNESCVVSIRTTNIYWKRITAISNTPAFL